MRHDRRRTARQVLVVEDDPVQASLMSRWLETDGGRRVVVVDSAERARDSLARSNEWDAIISDVGLPAEDGMALLRFARDRCPRTPIMMVTSTVRADVAVEALRSRADDLLFKPIERGVFVEKVDALIERAERRRREEAESVLAIGAHPDDVEIGCGGILLDHVARGDRVTILTLTSGERGGRPGARRLESKRAADLIQASLLMLDLPDTEVSEGPETIGPIQDAIAETAPTIIYTHTPHDAHQDHRSAYRATMVAARQVPNIFCYQSPSSTIDFRPSRFVVVDAHVERKLDVLAAFHSQVDKRSYLSQSMIRATLEYWGRHANYRSVEPLEVVRSSR